MIKRLSNISLQAKIAMAFMVIVLLILTVLGSVFYTNTAEAIKLSKKSEMITIAQETADKVDRFIFERLADIKVLSDSKVLTMPGIPDTVKLDYLNNVIEAYKTYEGIVVLDTAGRILLSTGQVPEVENIIIANDLDLSAVSDILLNTTGDSTVIFSRPLTNDAGIRIGTVATVMNLNAILEIVDNVKIGETGYATLSVSEPESVTDRMLYVVAPVENFESDGLNWHINIIQEKVEAYKVIDDFIKYLVLVSFVTIILFLFISIILSRFITEPIRGLMDKMNQMVAIGGESKSIAKQESRNEIRSLSFSFNSLLEQLNFMMQMVLEKTGEAADMKEINENFRDIFESVPNGILTIDASGQISSMNKTAAGILNLVDRPRENPSIFAPEKPEHEDFFSILANSLKHGRKYSGEICYIPTENDDAVPVIFNTLRQTDQNGELIGMTVIMNLLADKKRREETVLRAKRLSELGEMAAGMAHEIRNPLASIKGYAQCARLEFDNQQQTYKDLTIILNEVERLDWIIERFMNFARPNKPHKIIVDSDDLIDSTIRLMKNDFLQADVKIKYLKREKASIVVDADQIKQVLINVLLNSIQASAAGNEILVTTDLNKQDSLLIIKIVDEGIGISDEYLDQIFTPFYTTKEKGSGLGLSISTRIMENHGGTLEITNGPSKGVIVLIKLPLKGDQNHGR